MSFFAGLIAPTRIGSAITSWVENSFLGALPQYQMVKSVSEGFAKVEQAGNSLSPVLVASDGGWELGYLVERMSNGWVVVFLPQAPTPMSGSIKYVTADQIQPLDITMMQATAIVKHIGIGSSKIFEGTAG